MWISYRVKYAITLSGGIKMVKKILNAIFMGILILGATYFVLDSAIDISKKRGFELLTIIGAIFILVYILWLKQKSAKNKTIR